MASFQDFKSQLKSGGELVVPADWTQGRTVFGGASAGLLCEALQHGIAAERRLRYLEIGFVRPLEPELPFQIEMDDISAGRTVAVRSARIDQDAQTRVTAQATLVASLAGDTQIDVFSPPSIPAWDSKQATRIDGPGTPTFTRHIDFRAVSDGRPFSGRGQPEIAGWMRFDDFPDHLTVADLVCLIDSWPPVAASYFDRPVPLSSINWQMHFADPVNEVRGEQFLGYRARCNFFKQGYGSSSAEIWAPDGKLLAKSFQTFLIFG